jgi:adenosylmethionine-8-amino-7-oxononanoate aminotransferase
MPGVPPKAVATHNVYIEFDNGDRIIDGMGGAAVNIIGFGQESVIKAMKEEMDRCGFIYAGQYSNAAAEDLAEFLISKSEGYFSGVNFVGGGACAASNTSFKS